MTSQRQLPWQKAKTSGDPRRRKPARLRSRNRVPQHDKARTWLDQCLNGPAPVGIPWPGILAFVRLVTNPRIFQLPEPMEDAWAQIEEWLDCPSAWVPLPTECHREILGPLLINQSGRSNLVPDAHLAALAIEHGLILCSTDGDFARFSDLRWENPLG